MIYKAFGLTFDSELSFPELSPVLNKEIISDVRIRRKNLTDQWEKYADRNERFVIDGNVIMYRNHYGDLFRVEDGNTIYFSPFEGAEEARVRLYILGTCFGICFIQRQIFALHGSAIEVNGRAYVIVGDSGAGKSTLAAEFLSRGHKLLSDDVVPIELNSDREPMVIPGYPQQKLWQNSLVNFGENPDSYQPICQNVMKYAIPVSMKFVYDPLPLGGIFELIVSDQEDILFRRIQGLELMQTMYYHTYRNFLILRKGLMDWHFTTSLKIVKNVHFYQLNRPDSSFTPAQLADMILDTIYKEEKLYV